MADLVLDRTVIKMSDLDYSNSINDSDLLLAGCPAAGSIEATSKKLKMSTVSEYTLNTLANKEFTPYGQWNFTGPNAMIYVQEGNEMLSSDVPNLEYMYKTFITELEKLSANLYSDNVNDLYLPSYKGMVILGDNLDSISMVKKIYGSNTEWQRIEGRFLLGTGPSESNTNFTYGDTNNGTVNVSAKKYGGVPTAQLNCILKHSHKFDKPNCNFKKLPVYYVEVGVGTTITNTDIKNGLGIPRGHFYHKGGWGRSGNHTANVTQANIEQTIKMESIEKDYSFKAKGEIKDNSSAWKNEPHNNIPPFYVTHIWERIK